MKQVKFNPAKELQKLQSETIKKEKEINLKAAILDMLPGFDPENLIIYSTNRVGFGWRTPLTKEQVKQVYNTFPINGENHKMTFANSEKNFDTDSPLTVKWDNSHTYHHSKEFKINYPSKDFEITISVPPSHFTGHTYNRQFKGQHRGFGRYEMFNDVFIDYFYTQSYAGGSNVLYFLEGAEKLNEYENFVISGEFKYANELPD